jgi:hypothetical protein
MRNKKAALGGTPRQRDVLDLCRYVDRAVWHSFGAFARTRQLPLEMG